MGIEGNERRESQGKVLRHAHRFIEERQKFFTLASRHSGQQPGQAAQCAQLQVLSGRQQNTAQVFSLYDSRDPLTSADRADSRAQIVELAEWFRAEGWEARVEPIPGVFVHIDVLMAVLAERLTAVCVDLVSSGLVNWLRGKGIEIIPVPSEDAFRLGVNAISLGGDRVLTGAGARSLNEQMRARGLELYAPDLEPFTLGGGGAHCLGQALRREPVG